MNSQEIATPTLASLSVRTQGFQWKDVFVGLLMNVLPFLILIWIFWQMFSQAQKGAGQAFTFSRSGIRVYDPEKDKITFNEVAGLKEAKEELQEVVEFLKTPERFLDLGARIPRGVLLIGMPGTGKTLLARAVAGEAQVPFFYISGSEFVELFVGIGASRVRDAFSLAKKSGPSILFIDEIDAVGRVRGAGIGGGHDEREQTLNQILVEMDGFEKETRVIVLAATNRPDILDPALLRPGRFDRRITMDLPNIKEREEILRIHLKHKKVGRVQLRQVSERTSGFSGADLANLCNEAAILTARRNKKEITQSELLESIEKIILGPEKKSRVSSKQEREVAAYHEAGHAVVAHYLPLSHPVQKVSIIARGRAGGYTLKAPTEEKSFHFKKEFLDELAVLLAGYAAELTMFQDTSTGASSDLEIANDLARQLITRFGMSETLGPVTAGKTHEAVFLGKDMGAEKNYSEKTAEAIDAELKKILENALALAQRVIDKKKKQFDDIAQYLLKKEVIEKAAFERLIKDPKGSFTL